MGRKPRVLHVYKDYYPPVMGGVEMTIHLLAEGCRKRYDTAVLVNSGGLRGFERRVGNVPVYGVSEWGRAASAPVSPRFITALGRLAREADILHFHHPNPTGDLARFLSRPKVPAVMTYHSDVVRQQRAMAVYGRLQDWMMAHCRVIMPTSPNYMESSPWLQRHRERCRVVPLGIEVEQFAGTEAVLRRAAELRAGRRRPTVLFVGRLRYYKGLQFLVRAMPMMDVDVMLAGTGPMEAELRGTAAELGVADRLHFLGDIPDEEKVAWYHAADVFCMPSHLRSEAFGISQVEAMAAGLPVVSTDVPSGVPFVNKDGVSGLTVRAENVEALAAGINRIVTDGELRARLAEGARKRAWEMFTAERMCADVMDVYDGVLGRKSF